jgi:hypothetical protein
MARLIIAILSLWFALNIAVALLLDRSSRLRSQPRRVTHIDHGSRRISL